MIPRPSQFDSLSRIPLVGTSRRSIFQYVATISAKTALILVFWLYGFHTSQGQQSDTLQTVKLPTDANLTQGYSLLISYPNMVSTGYMPLKIELNANTAFARDRNFRLVVETIDSSIVPKRNGLRYEIAFQVEQGQNKYQISDMLPKWFAGQAFTFTLDEDDQPVPGYAATKEVRINPQTLLFSGSAASKKGLFESEIDCNCLYIFSSKNQSSKAQTILPELFSVLNGDTLSRQQFLNSYLKQHQITPQKSFQQTTQPTAARWQSPDQFWEEAAATEKLHRLDVSNLSNDWRSYQGYDVIILDSETAPVLRIHNKKKYAAIKHWQMLGGTIIVLGKPRNWRDTDPGSPSPAAKAVFELKRQELEHLRELHEGFLRNTTLKYDFDTVRAIERDGKIFLEHLTYYDGQRLYTPIEDNLTQTVLKEFKSINDIYHRVRTSNVWYRDASFKFELGGITYEFAEPFVADWGITLDRATFGTTIFLHPDENTIVPPQSLWRFAIEQVGDRVSPTLRRGVNTINNGNRFDDWKIPGISEPPVYTFIGFLSCFFVVVGPIAYWQTKRIERTYLMFAIAPALALLTTLAMFGYGIIADGFGSAARVRQLTWVDGPTKTGVERVRGTYFTGRKIDGSLTFPDQAEVFPLLNRPGERWTSIATQAPAKMGASLVNLDGQAFESSTLPVREQRQFVSHHPRPEIGCLSIRIRNLLNQPTSPSTVDDEVAKLASKRTISVTNEFDFALQDLILRNESLTLHWFIESLSPGETAYAKPISNKDASRLLGQMYTQHRPVGSSGESSNRRRNADNASNFSDFALKIRQELRSSSGDLNGIMESWLQQKLLTEGELPAGHFVATAAVSQDAIAIENCKLESSIRYVMGRFNLQQASGEKP